MTLIFLAIGFLWRLAMLLSTKSLWGDEFVNIAVAPLPLWDVIRWTIIEDVHPPVYLAILHGFVSLLGTHEKVFRGVSFIFSLGSLTAVAVMTRALFDRRTTLLAAFFVAISPYWLQSSNEIRSYSLFACVVAWGTYALIKVLQNQEDRRWWGIFTAIAALSVYVEHYAWFWLMACLITLLSTPSRRRYIRGILAVAVVSLPALGMVFYQALYKESMFEANRLAEYQTLVMMVKKITGLFWHFSCGYVFSMLTVDSVRNYLASSPFFWASACVTVFSVILMITGLWALWTRQKRIAMFFCLILIFPTVFLAAFYPIRLDARYLCFAAPVFFMLLAAGVFTIKKRVLRTFFVALFVGVNLYGAIEAVQSQTDAVHKEDYIALLEYTFEHAGPTDAVCGLQAAVEYYRDRLKLPAKTIYVPQYENLTPAMASEYDRIWLLDYGNMHTDVNNKRLEVFEKAMLRLGFRPMSNPVYFGRGRLTFVYPFEHFFLSDS